jgi:hypothetical protein
VFLGLVIKSKKRRHSPMFLLRLSSRASEVPFFATRDLSSRADLAANMAIAARFIPSIAKNLFN